MWSSHFKSTFFFSVEGFYKLIGIKSEIFAAAKERLKGAAVVEYKIGASSFSSLLRRLSAPGPRR